MLILVFIYNVDFEFPTISVHLNFFLRYIQLIRMIPKQMQEKYYPINNFPDQAESCLYFQTFRKFLEASGNCSTPAGSSLHQPLDQTGICRNCIFAIIHFNHTSAIITKLSEAYQMCINC